MKITKEWLKEKSACIEGTEWFLNQSETNAAKVLEKLASENRLDWANWLIVRVMKRKQYIQYAIYAAEQVIDIYEKQYPEDKRPRRAIDAAKEVLKNDTAAARAAAGDAWAAAGDAWAAAGAAGAAGAARAAGAAGDAAWAAAGAAGAAGAAAWAAWAAGAAWAAARAAAGDAWAAAGDAMKKKIIEYGIKLLKQGHGGAEIVESQRERH